METAIFYMALVLGIFVLLFMIAKTAVLILPFLIGIVLLVVVLFIMAAYAPDKDKDES